ncbi:SulP family inorganic anion transporter [Paraburkholderia sp. MMS20-SJTR3]|uniref:SulP family inorganic anion transporter n=1 Tax=Paraburkholderia sejongensis TaxID=2886946 RepID=A0ABS8K4W7_9BURK|nr:SulP family inorganic anion transporter [Paraburkholderia sp. MMS20-SJTR3]MCC8397020.1 SulP family inorganic anion transporter [Paraburkholderia sp. MMS20-SJTR3]
MSFKKYLTTLPQDGFAGVVVFLVALPLCLGIANASGVDPLAGLLAGIIGGLVVALLSGSQLSVSGPAAGLIVIVVTGMERVGGFQGLMVAVLLAGLLQVGFGMLKTGRFAGYVPASVTKGMLAAIGVLLVIKQLPVALGISDTPVNALPGGMIDTPLGQVSIVACVIAVVSVALIMVWDKPAIKRVRILRLIPSPLVVVALGIVTVLLLNSSAPQFAPPAGHRVMLPSLSSLGDLFAGFSLPRVEQLVSFDVWKLAVTLAIVASLETLLSLEALYQIDPAKRKVPADQELKAQGVGNMVAGIFGGLPITSVIVRSSVNVSAGGQTRMSAIVHGILLLASVFLLTGLINLIPLASLAAILIATGIKLAKPSLFVHVAREGKVSFVPFLFTLGGVLVFDLLIGICLGVICSLVFVLLINIRRPFTMVEHDDHMLLSFRKDALFAVAVGLKERLAHVPDNTKLVVDYRRAEFIDPEVKEVIDRFAVESTIRGVSVQYR